MIDVLTVARAALAGEPAWIVGGAIRDERLNRTITDLDVIVEGEPGAVAKRLGRAARGPAFELSDEFGAWRVIGPGQAWQIDVSAMRGGTLEADLALRDFTINAVAEPLEGGAPVDPHGGLADLEHGLLRMVGPQAFADDPLRVLRLARLACELDLTVDDATAHAARAHAPQTADVAQERVFAEFKRLLAADRALEGLALMDDLGLVDAVLPELAGLRGVAQNPYHHLDAHGHTLAVLEATIAIQRDPAQVTDPAHPEHAVAVAAVLDEPLADEIDRGTALRLGALLHDAGKPATRQLTPDGRVTFLGHDHVGAQMARDMLTRLHTSERLKAHVAALTAHHLRLGFLVHRRPLSRRAIYDYMTACEPVEVDVTLLSVADRLATRGRNADEAIAKHLDLAHEVLGEALAWRATPTPAPLIRGDELAAELGIEPGPRLGELLAAIAEARFTGEITTRDDAVAFARSLGT
jgi:poly(A) polymerase